jgi:hypothetical protein
MIILHLNLKNNNLELIVFITIINDFYILLLLIINMIIKL